MENLFVPYEVALKLKEKGFNEPCLARYDSFTLKLDYNFAGLYPFDTIPIHLPAPLYQQAVDWLRIKHGIWLYVDIESEYFNEGKQFMFGWNVNQITTNKSCGSADDSKSIFKTYNEALNKAIEEALKLI